MGRIFIPAKQPEDWQQFLAEPEKQWKTGYSARTLAHCWHAADGFPQEIKRAFAASSEAAFQKPEPLFIVPEYKVALKGHGPDSQNDVFVLAKSCDGALISITVEGKVDEPFGDTLGKWKSANNGFTENKKARLDDLQQQISLDFIPDDVYYQLIHRTASAMIEAQRFNAKYALMIVHSFSPIAKWFDAYARFVGLFNGVPVRDNINYLNRVNGIALYSTWISGDPRFLSS